MERKKDSVKYTITLPERVKLVAGELQGQVEQLDSQESKQFDLKLICPTGEGQEHFFQEMNILLEYTDILGNVKTLTLGPFEMEFHTFRRTEQLTTAITELEKEFEQFKNELTQLPEQKTTKTLAEGITQTMTGLFDQARKAVTEEEFEVVETTIATGRLVLQNLAAQSIRLIKAYQTTLQETHQFATKTATQLEQLQKQLAEIQTVLKTTKETLT